MSNEESFNLHKTDTNNNNIKFNFRLYGLILYDKFGQIIFNSSQVDSDNILTSNFIEIYSNIIKKLVIINEKSNQTNETLHFFLMNNENIKIDILNITKTNLYLLGAFNNDVNYSIRKLFLLHILLSFLNYMGEN